MSERRASILLVEDDDQTRRALTANLEAHGYGVRGAFDGEEALVLWELRRPDLILLDLGLPGIDGLGVLRRIRRDATTPVIVLSARGEERDKVEALDVGADDYLAKPFGMAELHARVRAALRRALVSEIDPDGVAQIGDLRLDPERRLVTVGGEELHLTPREYELLRCSSPMPAGSSPAAGCFGPCGEAPMRTRATTCMCTSPRSDARSPRSIPGESWRTSWLRSPASATGSRERKRSARSRRRRRGRAYSSDMIVATTPFLAGHRVVESKGHVYGLVVRSRGLGGNLAAAIRSLGGGEIKEYTELLEDTRRQAIDRMVQNATLMGANAVLSMRFDSSEIGNTMSEIVAYGTAVVVEPDASAPQPTTE